jgi:hypothetical protein
MSQNLAADTGLRLVAQGTFYFTTDSSGTQAISLYPVPTTAGDAINLHYVAEPPELTQDDDEFYGPKRFHRARVFYAAARAYESDEDNPEIASVHDAKFDQKVGEAKRWRRSNLARGPKTVQIVGVTR